MNETVLEVLIAICKYNRLENTINHYKYFCVYFHLLKMLCTIELKQLHSFLLHPVAKLLVHDIKKLTHFPSYTHKNVHTMHTHAHTIDLHTHTLTHTPFSFKYCKSLSITLLLCAVQRNHYNHNIHKSLLFKCQH